VGGRYRRLRDCAKGVDIDVIPVGLNNGYVEEHGDNNEECYGAFSLERCSLCTACKDATR
jgi:hypothetical protein